MEKAIPLHRENKMYLRETIDAQFEPSILNSLSWKYLQCLFSYEAATLGGMLTRNTELRNIEPFQRSARQILISAINSVSNREVDRSSILRSRSRLMGQSRR